MHRLVAGNVPFSDISRSILRDIMKVRQTDLGVLYGKTGTGHMESGTHNIAWFVGYVECKGTTYAFACAVTADGVTGKDVRFGVEKILENQEFL
jgi:beta-lactamase class D